MPNAHAGLSSELDDASVCIGDFWAASEGLDDLVVRIGRMIAYQEYNKKSPLNGLAAKWAAEHHDLLPIDNRNVVPPTDRAPSIAEPRAAEDSEAASTPPPVNPWAERIIVR